LLINSLCLISFSAIQTAFFVLHQLSFFVKYVTLRIPRPTAWDASIPSPAEEIPRPEMPHLMISRRLTVITEFAEGEHANQGLLELSAKAFRPGLAPLLTNDQTSLLFSDIAGFIEIGVRFYVLMKEE
jgi:hypothetical protein